MIQTEAIDIAGWLADEKFANAYPEGARPKRVVVSPADTGLEFIRPDWRYMFKLSSDRAAEQFWAEIIAYEIGELLGVSVPPAYAAFDSEREQCGALIEWFYKEGSTGFFSAGNFFNNLIQDFDRDKGRQHNLETAVRFNSTAVGGDHLYCIWEMLLFDTVIGNTDRHQDNWGHLLAVIKNPERVFKETRNRFRVEWGFAPWFDNGTSLGYQIPPNKFTQWRSDAYDRYIIRGQHHMRYSERNLTQIGHIASMRLAFNLAKNDAEMAVVVFRLRKKLEEFDLAGLTKVLDRCTSMNGMPDGGKFSAKRAEFVYRLTRRRIEIALDALYGKH
ncbi:conserved hypothetical protein [Pseudomonas sp. OF001]|uniref:hypothetical protein n=1 Tax=Pseudomonas sp. OF001 TaxID=2772300 RepID=UPI00191A5D92|nr:hypothetical protein [Pseudomonas sp. OF001]CAD5378998.1 conserved hypothetical protein [Pseudomonas sp. OF001]